MKVDFHFHLEEGPYSLQWLMRTARALQETSPAVAGAAAGGSSGPGTLPWIRQAVDQLKLRTESGCFSYEWLERYIRTGRARGIEQFGVVDHLYRFTEFKGYYERHMLLDDSPLGRLQREWLDRVCVYSAEQYLEGMRAAARREPDLAVGVEADYFPGGEDELRGLLAGLELDYVIGSVHFYEGWGFDNPDVQERFRDYSLPELYAGHYANVIRAAGSGLFDWIAHLDNLKVFGYRPEESGLLPMYREVAAALQANGIGTEINTGLRYRYPVKEMCPSPSLLRVLFEHNVPITLSSDAHFPDDIGMHLDEAVQAAREAGYREVMYYRGRVRHMAPIGEHGA
ncbi:PHP domain-containing protein [Paenibacillus chartarius]|uniref:Histidinol-phosphatase n=1 Tax=Paenibacillus chartarius TaxID=747481 RepID=A0ABV6DVC1_9BACL